MLCMCCILLSRASGLFAAAALSLPPPSSSAMSAAGKRSQINLACPQELLEALKTAARKRGLTITAFVHEAIRHELVTSSMESTETPVIHQELDSLSKRLEALEGLFSKDLL